MPLIPFNWDPADTDADKASGYSVPAGKYAQMYGRVANGGVINIDGSPWLTTSDAVVDFVDRSGAGPIVADTVLFTCPAGRSMEVDFQYLITNTGGSVALEIRRDGDVNYAYELDTASDSSVSDLLKGLKLSGGDQLFLNHKTGIQTFNIAVSGYYTDGAGLPRDGVIQLESGSTITKSGDASFTINEFDKYS